MKKVYISYLFIYLLATLNIFSQDVKVCGGTPQLAVPDFTCTFTMSEILTDFSNETPYLFNVFFHKITDENGNTPNGEGDNIGEYEYLEAVRELNIKYNRFNIFFKYYGNDVIKNSDYIEIRLNTSLTSGNCSGLKTLSQLIDYAQTNTDDNGDIFYKDNALNLFVNRYTYNDDYGCTSGNGIRYGNAGYMGTYSIYRYHIFQPFNEDPIEYWIPVVAHEIGHNFGLHHTNYNWDNPAPYVSNPDPNSTCDLPTYEYSEHVTRDESDADYNAVTAGDNVADTYASPYLLVSYYDETNCNYVYDTDKIDFTSLEIDEDGYVVLNGDCEANPNGVPYSSIQVYNLLDERFINPGFCMSERVFTNGQGMRMRCKIMESAFTSAIVIEDDLSTLYDPYKGIYFTVGNYNEWIANPATFQPGFGYEFVECGDGTSEMYIEPTEYEDTSFTYTTRVQSRFTPDSQVPITHYNPSAIIIEQTHDSQPRKCWNNPTKGGSNGGSITKFNDNVINTNITIYPKDSLQINDANLIFDLEDGLYKIDKNYNDGSQEQTIIIKNDD